MNSLAPKNKQFGGEITFIVDLLFFIGETTLLDSKYAGFLVVDLSVLELLARNIRMLKPIMPNIKQPLSSFFILLWGANLG